MSPINLAAGEMRTASLRRDVAEGNCVIISSHVYKTQVQAEHN